MVDIRDVKIKATSLNFEDVVEYIPLLTIDNNVVTEGRIMYFEILLNTQTANLFFDNATGDYCFKENTSSYEIGDTIQSNFFKHKTVEEFLSSDNLNNLTKEIKDIHYVQR